MGLLITPELSRCELEFTPANEKFASLRLRYGDRFLTVMSAYVPNSSKRYPAFLESLGGLQDGALVGDAVVLLGNFNKAHGQ